MADNLELQKLRAVAEKSKEYTDSKVTVADVIVDGVSVVNDDKEAIIALSSVYETKEDAAAELAEKVSKSGDTMTGTLNVPTINNLHDTVARTIATGTNGSSYFQSRKFRGEGNASAYYHAIDFGYANHDKVDFYEYGGIWNFWKNTSAAATSEPSNMVASLQLGKFLERGYTLTYPGKSGTFALTSDFADYATIAYVDEKTTLPEITISKSQVTSISEDGNSMTVKLTDYQYAILCASLYRAVKIDATDIGLWDNGIIYKLTDDSAAPSYTFFVVSSVKAGIGRIFVNSDKTANVYISYTVSKSDYSKHIHDSVVSNGDGTYMLVFGTPGTGD